MMKKESKLMSKKKQKKLIFTFSRVSAGFYEIGIHKCRPRMKTDTEKRHFYDTIGHCKQDAKVQGYTATRILFGFIPFKN